MALQHHVLLLADDPKETEFYSDLIHEVSDCQIDVLRRMGSAFDWMTQLNYQLVVIDSSGSEETLSLLEQIKRVRPMTSVILISSKASIEEAVAAIRMGAEDYLKKPFSLEAFQLAVKRGLDRVAIFESENSGASSYLNLISSCQMISAALDQKRIFNIVRSYFSQELKCEHTSIYQKKDSSELIKVPDTQSSEARKGDRAMDELIEIALQATNPLERMVESGKFYRFIERGQLSPALFVFRFRCVGADDFFCVCLSPEKPTSPEEFEGRLKMLKTQIEVTGKNIEHYLGVQH